MAPSRDFRLDAELQLWKDSLCRGHSHEGSHSDINILKNKQRNWEGEGRWYGPLHLEAPFTTVEVTYAHKHPGQPFSSSERFLRGDFSPAQHGTSSPPQDSVQNFKQMYDRLITTTKKKDTTQVMINVIFFPCRQWWQNSLLLPF